MRKAGEGQIRSCHRPNDCEPPKTREGGGQAFPIKTYIASDENTWRIVPSVTLPLLAEGPGLLSSVAIAVLITSLDAALSETYEAPLSHSAAQCA